MSSKIQYGRNAICCTASTVRGSPFKPTATDSWGATGTTKVAFSLVAGSLVTYTVSAKTEGVTGNLEKQVSFSQKSMPATIAGHPGWKTNLGTATMTAPANSNLGTSVMVMITQSGTVVDTGNKNAVVASFAFVTSITLSASGAVAKSQGTPAAMIGPNYMTTPTGRWITYYGLPYYQSGIISFWNPSMYLEP